MTNATYDPTGARALDRVRITIGDVDPLHARLADAEILALLAAYGTAEATAIPALDAIIARAAMAVDWASGAERESASQRVAQLREQRAALVARGLPDPAASMTASQVTRLVRGHPGGVEFAP